MKTLLILPLVLLVLIPYASAQEERLAVLHTESGDLVIEFFYDDAPGHVDNFVGLVEEGFYDQTVFHRIISGFMIQGGDPLTKPGAYESETQWGTGDPGYKIDAEFNDIKHNRGIISMARGPDPNSAGSQFFIVHADSNFLDRQYTAFGRLATQDSYATLDAIAALETIPDGTIPLDLGAGMITSAELVERDSIDGPFVFGEPDRVSEAAPAAATPEPYANEELGLEFDVPEGWVLQETGADVATPDIVMIGPGVGGHNPAVSIAVDSRNGTSLDEKVDEINAELETIIETGQLEIISEERITINGIEAYQKDANGVFVLNDVTTEVTFREAVLAGADDFYTITYVAEASIFDDNLDTFDDVVDSLSIAAEPADGGCLIATAAYGTELASQVQLLREVRDHTLLSTESGAAFMGAFNTLYYTFSPGVADLERQSPEFAGVVRLLITPMLHTLPLMSLAEEGSELHVLGLGISVIALNLGMYVAAPALAIYRLRQ